MNMTVKDLREIGDGLLQIADWFESHAAELGVTFDVWSLGERVSVFPKPGELRAYTRALGTFGKETNESTVVLVRRFGVVPLRVVFLRIAVCTRRVVGTRIVTREVELVPAVKELRSEEQEVVEWDCPESLLASDSAVGK